MRDLIKIHNVIRASCFCCETLKWWQKTCRLNGANYTTCRDTGGQIGTRCTLVYGLVYDNVAPSAAPSMEHTTNNGQIKELTLILLTELNINPHASEQIPKPRLTACISIVLKGLLT